jgi:PhoH-like ATPase
VGIHHDEAQTSTQRRRTYVLDTSVLLADPAALRRFAEHEVVLPVVVITELEAKRHHPELGYFARSALRMLDEMRVSHGRLDTPVPVGEEGGSVRVELNHTDASSLPSGFRLGDNDTRILAVARNLADEGYDVTLVSKDLPMRIKASAVGLDAEEYRGETTSDSDTGYSGMAELTAAPRWAGSARTSRCTWSAATARPSGSTAAAPSSGSPSTSCSTRRSGSSRWAAGPAPASPRSPCARASRR